MVKTEAGIRQITQPRSKTKSNVEIQLETEKKREVVAEKAALANLRKSKNKLSTANIKLTEI